MPEGTRLARGTPLLITLPNAVTFARLCAVPATVWLVLRSDLTAAFWLFALASASDAVDGLFARRLGPSAVGAVLDPIADKALLISMYVALAGVRALPNWISILVVFRDLLIIGGVLVLAVLGQAVAIRPLAVSRLNTVLQICLVGAVLLRAGYGLGPKWILTPLIWLVAASTAASGAAYVGRVARGP